MILATVSVLLISATSGVLAQSSTCGFEGGFALRYPGNSCPSDAPVYCGTGLEPRCCPSGYTCAETKYCCQNGQDCSAASEAHPQCPVSTWSLWSYNSNGTLGWCCEPNFFGFAYLDNSGVGCQPVGQTIDTTTYHTVSQLFESPLACSTSSTSSSTSTSAIAKSTSTSSQTSSGTSASTTALSTSQISQSSSQTSSSTAGGAAGSTTSPVADQSKGSSFGPGAIAGVAVGAAAVLVLIGLAAWCIGRRSSKKKAATAAAASGNNSSAYDLHHGKWQQEKNPLAQEMPYYEPVPVHEIGHHESRPNQIPGRYEMP